MGVKGKIKADHIPINNYELLVAALLPLTLTSVSGLELVTDKVDLPDRTSAPGGNMQAIEFTAKMPLHHSAEVAAINVWHNEGIDPISSTVKKPATLVLKSGTGTKVVSWALGGLWVYKLKTPDLEMENEGDMAELEITFCCDSATLLP